MKQKTSYSVRIVLDDPKKSEVWLRDLSKSNAEEWFLFYTRAALELSLNTPVWCVNLFCGHKCIKILRNYGL